MASPQTHDQTGLLMERGVLALPLPGNPATLADTSQPVEIYRGMTVQSAEGCTVGHVAAVLLDQEQHQVTHILLQALQQIAYHLAPIEMIDWLVDDEIRLCLPTSTVTDLPLWHSS